MLFYWKELEKNSTYRFINSYKNILAAPSKYVSLYVKTMADLFYRMGNLKETALLMEYYVKLPDLHWGTIRIDIPLILNLDFLSKIFYDMGNFNAAIIIRKEIEKNSLSIGYKEGIQNSLIHQARILSTGGD